MMTDTEARIAEFRAQALDRVLREKDAQRLVLNRAGVSSADLETIRRTLTQLAGVNLDDLKVPPGFNLLPDGSVGSVNQETPEWQRWSTANDFLEDCRHLGCVLARFV